MSKDEKLEWIYKGPNNLVDREDYLLGRKVDKPLEQLNEEEKPKKFVLPVAKNHVEHECIPPSIRDFNKIVLAEQVDLSAKLQEDPLVAIKKREEEARRQFLQNPVQLKKLQDALKKKESQKNKHKKSKKKHKDDDLDEQIKAKLKQLKSNSLGTETSKKELKKDKKDVLNTILMHKFNALKDKLSDDDLKDILNGKISDTSDEEKSKKKKKKVASSDSDSEAAEIRSKKKINNSNNSYRRRKSRSRSRDFNIKGSKPSNTRDISYSSSEEYYKTNKSRSGTRDYKHRGKRNISSSDEEYGERKQQNLVKKYKRKSRSRSRSKETRNSNRTYSRERRSNDLDRKRKDKEYNKQKSSRTYKNSSSEEDNVEEKVNKREQVKNKENSSDEISNSELDKKIMAQLKLLRGESEAKINKKTLHHANLPDLSKRIQNNSSDSSDSEQPKKAKVQYPEKPKHLAYYSDSDEKQSRRNIKKRNSSSSDSSERDAVKYKFNDSEDEKPQKKSFGLISSDGKKIALKKTEKHTRNYAPLKKVEEPVRPDRKHVKRMTEEEKETLRKEMMSNAKTRDKEREKNVKMYREKDKREEEIVSEKYDPDLVHNQLLKSAKHSSVEDRIKSKLNTIQRSSRHMDHNFSKRQ